MTTTLENEARKIYLDLIRALPQEPEVKKLLNYKGRDLWWYLFLSEKNIWLDKTVHRIYSLLSATDPEKVRDFRPSSWALVLAYLKNALGVAARMVYVRLLLLSFKAASFRSIEPGSIGFFSLYPTWWRSPEQDMFFQSLPSELSRQQEVVHLVWLLGRQDRQGLSRFLASHKALVLNRLIGLKGLLSLFDPRLIWRFVRLWNWSLNYSCTVRGREISPWIREELYRSLTGQLLGHWLLMDEALKKCRLQDLKALLFRLEFQPMERPLLNNARGKTLTIGFQHSALGKNFLNYAFCNGEFKTSGMPLPDHIFTSGDMGFRFMKEAGFEEGRIAVAGGLKFSSLIEYCKARPAKEVLRAKYGHAPELKIILVPTSPLLAETQAMLKDLSFALEQTPEKTKVLIKVHPNATRGEFCRGIEECLADTKMVSYEILPADAVQYDNLSLSDAILLTGGTVALEAMILGNVPIIYGAAVQFSHNPMLEYPEAVLIAHDRDSLVEAMRQLCDPDQISRLKKNWTLPFRDMLLDIQIDPLDHFQGKLREVLA